MLFEFIIVGIFGLIIGSFLNVLILRLHTGRSTAGRSGCMSCGAQLGSAELVPVISFFLLRGRCKSCGSKISNQYWLVEIITSILFVLVWVQGFSLFATAMSLVIISLLMIIAVYDMRHTIIPNSIVYLLIAVSLITALPLWGTFVVQELPLHFIMVLIGGAMVALPIFTLWLVSGGRWMGFGDVKLTFAFGLILGAQRGFMAVMLGFIVGACVGVLLMYLPKVIKRLSLSPASSRFTMSSEIPFAPFLIAGFLLVFLLDIDIITLIGSLYIY
ncbi:hypothetical protein COB18_02380 [Candidatus Kaiserbacteria bacterium]|nr:MAG: hypothetical protein COB18_02380 [Candidatus Kaiserbacteria bacterium]